MLDNCLLNNYILNWNLYLLDHLDLFNDFFLFNNFFFNHNHNLCGNFNYFNIIMLCINNHFSWNFDNLHHLLYFLDLLQENDLSRKLEDIYCCLLSLCDYDLCGYFNKINGFNSFCNILYYYFSCWMISILCGFCCL